MKHICATLLLLCNSFTGDLNKEFIDKVTSCALQYNSILAEAVNGEEYMLSANLKKVKKYPTFCSSVEDYIDLLSFGEPYKEFKEELINQWMTNSVDIPKLINHLNNYAEDKNYKSKLIKIISQLQSL